MNKDEKLWRKKVDAKVELELSQINILLSDFLIRIKEYEKKRVFTEEEFLLIKERVMSLTDEMYKYESRSIFHTMDLEYYEKNLPKLESFLLEIKNLKKNNISDNFCKQIFTWAIVYRSIEESSRLKRLREIIGYCISNKLEDSDLQLIVSELDAMTNSFSKVNDSYRMEELLYWIVFRVTNIIDQNVFRKEVIKKKIYYLDDDCKHILLGDDHGIKGFVKELYEKYGCTVVNKSIKKRKVTIVLERNPYTITLTRYKIFFLGFWKKVIQVSDVNGMHYNYSQFVNIFNNNINIK